MPIYAATKMRDENRRKVFDLVRRRKIISRTDISTGASISPPTVMKIINYFQEKNIVVDQGGISKDGPGRRLQQLSFNADAASAVGINFEGHFLNIGVVNLDSQMKYYRKYFLEDIDSLRVASPQFLTKYIEIALDESAVDRSRILGAGLGIPKIIDTEKQEISSFLDRNQNVRYQETSGRIKEIFGFPLFMENDVNAETIGEFSVRNLPPDGDIAYLSLGTGLGAGFILNGVLRRGVHFTAGEIGHMYLAGENDEQLENLINLDALLSRWGFAVNADKDGAAKESDPMYRIVLEYLSAYLAKTVANIVAIVDVDLTVLGGVMAEYFGEHMLAAVKEKCARLVSYDMRLELARSACPGVIGTAMIAMENTLDEFLAE